MAFAFENAHDGVEELGEKTMGFMCERLPYAAALIRLPLEDINYAAKDMISVEKRDRNPKADKTMGGLYHGWYRLLRVAYQLELAPMLNHTEKLQRKNVDIVDWVEDIVLQARTPFSTRGVELEFKTDMQSHQVAINPRYLSRALWQLLSNALKAYYPDEEGTVTVSLQSSRGQVLITVADDGCGISPEQMERVFKMYGYYGHIPSDEDGYGIGLPVSRHIAELHGGRLMLSSTEGKGTTVTLALPDVRTDEKFIEPISIHGSGFPVALIELSDGLNKEAFLQRYLDF